MLCFLKYCCCLKWSFVMFLFYFFVFGSCVLCFLVMVVMLDDGVCVVEGDDGGVDREWVCVVMCGRWECGFVLYGFFVRERCELLLFCCCVVMVLKVVVEFCFCCIKMGVYFSCCYGGIWFDCFVCVKCCY